MRVAGRLNLRIPIYSGHLFRQITGRLNTAVLVRPVDLWTRRYRYNSAWLLTMVALPTSPQAQHQSKWPDLNRNRWPVLSESAPQPEARPPDFSDEALALRFAVRHANDLRFVAKWNKWLSWTGTHWWFDDTLAALDKARVICREAAAECNSKDALKTAIASAKTVAAVERLARADRRLAATVDQWDADPGCSTRPTA